MIHASICRMFGITALLLCMPFAHAAAIRCDTCLSDEDFKREAVRQGPGTHLVFNVAENRIQQYSVREQPGGETNTEGTSHSTTRENPTPMSVERLHHVDKPESETNADQRPR